MVDIYNLRFQVDLEDAFVSSSKKQIAAAGKEYAKIVAEYADLVTNGEALRKVNQSLANGMRTATVNAYRANVLQERVAPSYRPDDKRYGDGKLLNVLENAPTMAVGTAEGIGFVDGNLLDRTAAQWYRLNFGAEPGVGFSGTARPQPTARIRFGANQGASLKFFSGMGSGFNVPNHGRGYFNQLGQFFLGAPKGPGARGEVRRTRGRPSSGIRPRRFLDQGLVYLADNLGDAYIKYFDDKLREAVSRGKGQGGTNVGPV